MAKQLKVNPDSDALVVVDVQRDFCEGGALAVPGGDDVVPVLNGWLRETSMLKVATRDWHPSDHESFEEQGGPWPPHCVRGTEGAKFHPQLASDQIDEVFSLGTEPEDEGYSGFEAGEMAERLREQGIKRLWVGGLATDYCVAETVVEGCEEGFEVQVIEDAIRGIGAEPGDVREAKDRMRDAGASFVSTPEVEFA
jgi:nicotinamidase/pyrazinamidase